MIANLVEYGGAIYWLLLFFFCIVTTLYAERRTSVTVPALWGVATLTYVFGFTSYDPSASQVLMGLAVYLIIGAIFTMTKWATLVQQVKNFVESVSVYTQNSYELRHLAHLTFEPMDADDVMTLPPDPFEFRTRLTCWFLFWPSFTIFRCFAHGSRWLSKRLWNFFHKISTRLYER